jgi:hypothetical protein
MSLLQNLSIFDVQQAFEKSQQEIAFNLKLPDLDLTTDPMSLKVPKDYESKQRITQYLQDIGYIKEGSAVKVSDLSQQKGIRRWRQDSKRLSIEKFQYDLQHSLFQFHPLDSDSIDFLYLAAQMGFEAEVEIKQLPKNGEVSLLSRIIHYRLRVFGVYTNAVESPFNEQSLSSIKAVANILEHEGSLLEVINLLGNVRELSASFMKQQGDWVFAFKLRSASPEVLKETYINNIGIVNTEILKLKDKKRQWKYEHIFVATGVHYKDSNGRGVWAGRNGFRYYRNSLVFGTIRRLVENRLSASDAIKSSTNKLGLELLQLRLWLLGFYKGELDGDWGPLTILAVREFLLSDDIVDINQVVKPVEGGYAVVNMRYLFNRLLAQTDSDADNVSASDAQELSLSTFSRAQNKAQWEALENAHNKVEAQDFSMHLSNPRRRRAFSFRGLLCAVGRFFNRLTGSIAQAVKRVWAGLKKMAALAVKIFKQGLEMIKQGVQVVSLSVKRAYYWLLEKPIFTLSKTALVLTRFTRDGDAFHFVSNADEALIKRHHHTIRKMNLAFAIMATIGFKALAVIKEFATFNWLRLAFKLYLIFSTDIWHELKFAYARYQRPITKRIIS